ncbi:MAG: AAA family ATPase [Halioglobus sp.]
MYEYFYNLQADPFRLSPDHRFCYEHKGYAKARAYMTYAFMRAEGFVMVTGRPGTGKTTLIADLIQSLAGDKVTTANLVCTQLQADDLLKTVAYSFGVGTAGVDKAELLQRLYVIFHKWHRDGGRALLIVDEAQDLSITAVEELRLLTNIQVDGQPLLQIFLLGQPELRDLILSPQMEQVHQRIVAASHLEALELEETEAYVRHRLEAVGWQGDPALSKAIFPLIYKFSEGIPRRINLICSRLFLHGGVEQRHEIGVQDLRVVVAELQGENLAAGNKFAETDFEVEDEFEQIAVVAPAPSAEVSMEAPVEVRLHAVSNESFSSPVSEPAVDASTPTRRPVEIQTPERPPVVIPAPVDEPGNAAPVEAQAAAPEPSSQLRPAKPVPQPKRQATRPVPAAARSAQINSGAKKPAAKTATRQTQSQSRGARAWAVLAILVISLSIFLGFFATRGGSWGDWHSKLQVLWERMGPFEFAPFAADPGPQAEGGIAAVAGSVQTSFDEGGRDIASVVASNQSDPGEAQSELETPVADEFAIAVPSAGALAGSNESAISAQPTAQDDRPQPPAEGALPAQDQVLFVAFAFDSVDISPHTQKALDRVVETMSQSLSSVASITGFSDSQGEEAYNLMLSRQRAEAVEQYLVGEGIERERLQVKGRGALYDFTEAEISAAGLENEGYRIVQIRISSGPGSIN